MRVIRILSLDGGGIRGLFQAYFLTRFCEQAGINGNQLWKYFDIITGTSIGGISALLYAHGQSPAELVALLNKEGPEIFPHETIPFNRGPASTAALLFYVSRDGYVYPNAPLKRIANDILGDTKMFQLKTNVFITSVLIQNDMVDGFKNYSPRLFSNVISPYTHGANYYARDVALTTSAAPAFFPAYEIPGDVNPDPSIINQYVDGGLYQNNPVALAYAMSNILYPGNNKLCILSVGTGIDKSDPYIPVGKSLKFHQLTSVEQNELLQQWRNKGYSAEQIGALKAESLRGVTALPTMVANSLTATIGGAQEAVSKQFEIMSLYGGIQNGLYYYRFQTILDPLLSNQLDDATLAYRTYLKEAANAQYTLDQLKISAFIENSQFN